MIARVKVAIKVVLLYEAAKKCPNQETGLRNRIGMSEGSDLYQIDYHANSGPIWYLSYSTNQFLGWDFFAVSYSKTALPFNWKSDLINDFQLKIYIYI